MYIMLTTKTKDNTKTKGHETNKNEIKLEEGMPFEQIENIEEYVSKMTNLNNQKLYEK